MTSTWVLPFHEYNLQAGTMATGHALTGYGVAFGTGGCIDTSSCGHRHTREPRTCPEEILYCTVHVPVERRDTALYCTCTCSGMS